MELIHNAVFQIHFGDDRGLYRVILAEGYEGRILVARLDPSTEQSESRGGRKKKEGTNRYAKKAKPPLVKLMWTWNVAELLKMKSEGQLSILNIEPENFQISDKGRVIFEYRVRVMRKFLDFFHFREQVLLHGGLASLVAEARQREGASKTMVYQLFSLLCRFGFHESSLRSGLHNCGAPGKLRPCDSGGRKKPGAKTVAQNIAAAFGTTIESVQPGMSSDWRARIIASYSRIPTPKPSIPDICTVIIESSFITTYRQENGQLVKVDPKLGCYPNRRQIRRVIETEFSRLQRLLEKTTQGHFKRSMRGLVGRNWEGVFGPGHTWAIDSTIGDIYLRSSVNRAWIIGRPIVYIIVDVWSTAIVGFYVCLTGPSWNTAKVSLFSASASPEFVAELWGYQPMLTLNPAPTMCGVLMCDRGEYLSKAASITAAKLIPTMSYAPPYRPDLKGLVEVLHRIEKDRQYFFVPGAIDQRRAEYELRKYRPQESVFTMKEYVAYLATEFSGYNLSADRENRLDAHMQASGAFPSPAGLWHWGHEMGIGFSRSFPRSELISTLLPSETARVTRQGILLGGKEYRSDVIDELQWTALARNFGTMDIHASYFPGSISRIWTPHPTAGGHLELQLASTANASPELTFDEAQDAYMYSKASSPTVAHIRSMAALHAKRQGDEIIARAKEATREAIERDCGSKPSVTEARAIENASTGHEVVDKPNSRPGHENIAEENEAEASYLNMLSNIFEAQNNERELHE